MDENTPSRADALPVTPGSIAVNIRRYLDVHRPGSPSATVVVAALASGRVGQQESESAPGGLATPAVRPAVDSLRHHRELKTS